MRRIARLYPLYSGCGTLANSGWFPALGSADDVVVSKLRCGYELEHPGNDFVGRSVYFFGDLDPKLTWLFKRVLRPGDTVLDIGANLGMMSLFARSMVGDAGRVIAFEPQPRLAGLMRQSIQRNQIDNIEVCEMALGETDDELILSVPGVNRGSASLVRSLDDVSESYPVPVRRASDLFGEIDVGACRLVKLDVEGFEAVVIAGALDYWREETPDVVVFEFNAGEAFSESEVHHQLRSLDYEFFTMPKRLLRPVIMPVLAEQTGVVVGHDMVAVRRGISI